MRVVLAVFGPKRGGKSALLAALGQLCPVEPTCSMVGKGKIVLLEAPRAPGLLSAAVSVADGALIVMDAASLEAEFPDPRDFWLEPMAAALTKVDLLEPEEAPEAMERARETLSRRGWEVPLIPISTLDGRGLAEMEAALLKGASNLCFREGAPFRALVLRKERGRAKVFILSGEVRQGEEILAHPEGALGKVERIKALSEQPGRGEWALLWLSGKAAEKASGGTFLSSPELPRSPYRPDLKLRPLPGGEGLQNWVEVKTFLGPFGVPGKVMLLRKDLLSPGEEGYCQLRLTGPLLSFRGDRVVLSGTKRGVEPLAAGLVLDPFPRRHRGTGEEVLEIVKRMEVASGEEALALSLEGTRRLWTREDIVPYYLPLDKEMREEAVRRLEEEGKVVIVKDEEGRWLSGRRRFEEVAVEIRAILEEFHRNDPISVGLREKDLRRVLSSRIDKKSLKCVLLRMEAKGEIERDGDLVRLSGFRLDFSGRFGAIREAIERLFLSGRPSRPPRPEEVPLLLPDFDKKDVERVLEAMMKEGIIVKIAPQVAVHRDVARIWEEELKGVLRRKGRITVSEFRDMVETSRKFAIAFLEACDALGLTKREGDYHVAGNLRRSVVEG